MKSLRSARVLPFVFVFVFACAEAGPNPADSTDSLGDSKDTPADSTALMVAKFGEYHVDIFVPVEYPTATPDGEFVTVQASRQGNRVGRVNGRLSYWENGKPTPTYMFPADTNESAITPSIVNDRGEIILVPTAMGSVRPVYIWRGGQLKTVIAANSACPSFKALNNRGLMVLESACTGPPTYYRQASPFPPDETAKSSRFALETCDYSTGLPASAGFHFRAVNDSNEILVNRSWAVFWEAGGCRRISGLRFAGETGFVAAQAMSGGFALATLTDGYFTAGVDQLLDSASRASWHILDVTGVTAEGAMIASGIRLADNATMTVTLARIP